MAQFIIETEHYPRKSPLRITGKVLVATETVKVTLIKDGIAAHGEAIGAFYLGETPTTMRVQLESIRGHVQSGITREQVGALLPRGGARNALDAALWDLEAKLSGKSIWEITGIDEHEINTVETISIDDPESMAETARGIGGTQIKLKLDDQIPVERVRAVRESRPDALIVVDVNQGWTFNQLQALVPELLKLDVKMIEQPLPRGQDQMLSDYSSPITLCADESCLDSSDLDQVAQRYDMINIKLDKTGGLTEALNLAHQALRKNLELMVGNMGGTSLVDSPAYVVAQLCNLVDLDGPLSLNRDVFPSFSYKNGLVRGYDSARWG